MVKLTKLVFDKEAMLSLCYIVLLGNLVISKNTGISLWKPVPTFDLANFYALSHHDMSTIQSVVNLTRRLSQVNHTEHPHSFTTRLPRYTCCLTE